MVLYVKTRLTVRVWRMRDLIIEGETVIFKSLAISKTVHLAYYTVEQLIIIKKNFIWQREKPKINKLLPCEQLRK